MVSEELAGTLVRTTDETKKAKAKDFFNGVFLDLQEYRRPFQLEHARRGDRDEGHHQRVGAREHNKVEESYDAGHPSARAHGLRELAPRGQLGLARDEEDPHHHSRPHRRTRVRVPDLSRGPSQCCARARLACMADCT